MDLILLHDGRAMWVHEKENCLLEHCCLHNPSDHPLNSAPLDWVQVIKTMFRRCSHDLPHPDPDDLSFKAAIGQFMLIESISSVHIDKCDGCCQRKDESA